MTQEEKLTGTEPASEMTIAQKATLDFMVSMSALRLKNPKEVAQDAKRFVEAYFATCNDEDWDPGQSLEG